MYIKPTQLYGWETEPVDERPSELMSTNFSQLSGLYAAGHGARRASVTATGWAGHKSLLVGVVIVIGAGAYALDRLVPVLRHVLT